MTPAGTVTGLPAKDESMTASTASQLLDREFLDGRALLLQLAALLDRLDRASGSLERDSRRQAIQRALGVLTQSAPNRAEQIQLLFSRPYDPNWKANFRLTDRLASPNPEP
jgi:hypothetical protein